MEGGTLRYPVVLAGSRFDASRVVQDAQPRVDIKRVLTKKFFMFIIHRITIQRDIAYNLGFVLSYSIPQFRRESDISRSSRVLTESGSSVF